MGEMVMSHYGNLFPQELSIRALLSFSRHALWLSCYAYGGFFLDLPGIHSSKAFGSNSVCNKNKLHTHSVRSASGQYLITYYSTSIAMIYCFVYKVIEAYEVRM